MPSGSHIINFIYFCRRPPSEIGPVISKENFFLKDFLVCNKPHTLSGMFIDISNFFNPFPHEYSCLAPPTMNNSLNKLSFWYIVMDQIYHVSISKQSRPRSGSPNKSCLIWVCSVCKGFTRCLHGVNR